jgi:hypothetical protein
MAIFQLWNQNRFQNPISISRDELMRISKISSTATYHKCIKELQERQYVEYNPSFNPFKGSTLNVLNLDFYTKPVLKKDIKNLINNTPSISKNNLANELVNEQELNKYQTSSKHVPYINNTNSINMVNVQIQKNENYNSEKVKDKNEEITQKFHPELDKAKLRKKKGKNEQSIPPGKNDVIAYFQEKKCPEIEAEKFFNYFESNGWLVGGKTKMKDWKAAARNWLLNSQNFNTKVKGHPEYTKELKPNHLNISNQKNYGEPL